MRIYHVNSIWGYYLGRYFQPTWTDRPPSVPPVVSSVIRGIQPEIVKAYYEYLWRLGEHTFGTFYSPGRETPGPLPDTERFADVHLHKLWPKYGRLWSSAGAASNPFPDMQVHLRRPLPKLYEETESRPANEVILRYNEMLWRGRVIGIGPDGRWYIMLYRQIGPVLMFERRGTGVAKRYQDSWDFGMSYWEYRNIAGRKHLYLWGGAEVTYLGFATRHTNIIFSVEPLRA